jgi:hypothetical protein
MVGNDILEYARAPHSCHSTTLRGQDETIISSEFSCRRMCFFIPRPCGGRTTAISVAGLPTCASFPSPCGTFHILVLPLPWRGLGRVGIVPHVETVPPTPRLQRFPRSACLHVPFPSVFAPEALDRQQQVYAQKVSTDRCILRRG